MRFPFCIIYFSVAMIKIPWRKQHKEERVYFALQFQKGRVNHGEEGVATVKGKQELETDGSHFHPHTGSRQGMRAGSKTRLYNFKDCPQ